MNCAASHAWRSKSLLQLKTGVMLGDFFGNGVSQFNLFDEYKPQVNSGALMLVIDGLNQSGKGNYGSQDRVLRKLGNEAGNAVTS